MERHMIWNRGYQLSVCGCDLFGLHNVLPEIEPRFKNWEIWHKIQIFQSFNEKLQGLLLLDPRCPEQSSIRVQEWLHSLGRTTSLMCRCAVPTKPYSCHYSVRLRIWPLEIIAFVTPDTEKARQQNLHSILCLAKEQGIIVNATAG